MTMTIENTNSLRNAQHVVFIDRYFSSESGRIETIEREQKSKVYKVYAFRSPSGIKYNTRVWNTRLNKMVEVDNRYIVSVVD